MLGEMRTPNCGGASTIRLPVSWRVVGFMWQLAQRTPASFLPRSIRSGVGSALKATFSTG